MKVTPVVSGSPLYSAARLILDELELNIMARPVQTGPSTRCVPRSMVVAAAGDDGGGGAYRDGATRKRVAAVWEQVRTLVRHATGHLYGIVIITSVSKL